MQLTQAQTLSVAFGYTAYEFVNNGVQFFRFSKPHAAYIGREGYTTAGIWLDFYTDSAYFAFSYLRGEDPANRPRQYFDVLIDGKILSSVSNFDDCAQDGSYKVELPCGKKRVTLILPHACSAILSSIELSNGAAFYPVEKKRKIAFFGDSITQGYDGKTPALTYVNRIGLQTDSEVYNFGIGDTQFNPCVIDDNANVRPDVIFVAYGTNDWSRKSSQAEFIDAVKAFFDKLRAQYPTQPMFVILPIWRRTHEEMKPVGTLQTVRALLLQTVSEYTGVRAVDIWEEIPHEEDCFADGLHPNGRGFAYYADGVLKHIGDRL